MGQERQRYKAERFISKLNEKGILKIKNLPISGGKKPDSVGIHYYQNGKLEQSKGQFFVSLPDELAKLLPGSYVTPERFFQELPNIDENLFELKKKLLGDYYALSQQEAAFKYNEKGFGLNVFGGLINDAALNLTEIAAKGFADDFHRTKYQNNLLEIVKPVLGYESEPSDPPAVRIVEDCIASGDTIVGVLAALSEKTKLNDINKVRVDVAVASAQGILLLRKFAQDNGIHLELNVGYMAFGLSKGNKTPGKGLEHSNYLTYPAGLLNELDNIWEGGNLGYAVEGRGGIRINNGRPHSSSVQVVGDMGDAGKKPDSSYDVLAPWHEEISQPKLNDGVYPTFVYLANGGYLMRGYIHHILGKQAKDFPEIIFEAKRRFDEGKGGKNERGYGVLLSKIPEEILIS